MEKSRNTDEFYKRLKEQLEQDVAWPSLYLYKFIVPTSGEGPADIEKIFDGTGAVISTKQSRNGKYTSLSIKVQMASPDAVIAKYREVGKIEGIISL